MGPDGGAGWPDGQMGHLAGATWGDSHDAKHRTDFSATQLPAVVAKVWLQSRNQLRHQWKVFFFLLISIVAWLHFGRSRKRKETEEAWGHVASDL